MKTIKIIVILLICISISHKKTPAPDLYTFLNGTWQYDNNAQGVLDVSSKISKGTKVPTKNTQFKFVVGEDYWRNVVNIGTD